MFPFLLMIGTMIKPLSVYEPLKWQIGAWRDKSAILLCSGAAGGGKSRFAAEKLHAFCLKYPNAMALMLRKTRESTKNSIVLMMKNKVIGNDPRVTMVSSAHRFEYSNGSILAWGGMKDDDQRESIRSIGQDGGLDICWLEEAHLFELADFEELLPRMRGKAANWTQIIVTTNPDAPGHWIKKRLIDGKLASYHKSTWIDNPYNPPEYVDKLNMLTGNRLLRLRDGAWVMAEGAIYPEWNEENIDNDADYDPRYAVYAAVDDGYSNPRCVLLIQDRPCKGKPDRICVFAEYYQTQRLASQTLEDIWGIEGYGYPIPELLYHDPAAVQFGAEAQNYGFATWGAANNVAEGIKKVREFIRDGNNERRLLVHPRCVNLIEQMPSYRNSESNALLNGDPKPIKENDHAVDALRYFIYTRYM